MRRRIKNILIALDQLANAIANGAPDETLSSRAHRAREAGKPGWRRVAGVIDWLFWWDKDHCRESWLAERDRHHLPREMWAKTGAKPRIAGLCCYENDSKEGQQTMNLRIAEKALVLAEVPGELHEKALDCLRGAKRRARGLTLHQLRARLAAKRIAQALPWSAETVEDALPAYASFGVAPNGGNGVNGDNVPWAEHYQMPDGSIRQVWMLGKPRGGELPPGLRERAQADVDARRAAVMAAGGQWLKNAPCTLPLELDANPESLDYQCACARNYWGHRFFSGGAGIHPRSVEARTAWLRSNGGEREAWSRGQPVGGGIQQWTGQRGRWSAQVLKQGDVWQVNLQLRLAGRWQLGWRLGYEIDNARHAHPRPGFEKRACITWSMRPERRKP